MVVLLMSFGADPSILDGEGSLLLPTFAPAVRQKELNAVVSAEVLRILLILIGYC